LALSAHPTEGFVIQRLAGAIWKQWRASPNGRDYLSYRIRSVEYLGEKLLASGIKIIEPPGGHAIYIDAGHFCPHIPKAQFPGQAVVCGLYRIAGVRSCEIGS
jgi:tryptophanase